MTRTLALMIATAMAFGSGAAVAAGQNMGHSYNQAELSQLSPEVRQYILSRMGPEQRADELIETTRLNLAARDGFAGTEDAREFNQARFGTGDATMSSDRYVGSNMARDRMHGDAMRSSDMHSGMGHSVHVDRNR